MSVCVVDEIGFCDRHQQRHSGHALTLALEDSPRGEDFRRLNDEILDRRRYAASHPMQPVVCALKPTRPKRRDVRKPAAISDGRLPGTALAELLKRLKLRELQGCGCGAMLLEMDRLGAAGCRKQLESFALKLRRNSARYRRKHWRSAAKLALSTGTVWRLRPWHWSWLVVLWGLCRPEPTNRPKNTTLFWPFRAPLHPFRALVREACRTAPAASPASAAAPIFDAAGATIAPGAGQSFDAVALMRAQAAGGVA